MPAPHNSIFTGWMLFLMLNQQCQSTEHKYQSTKGDKAVTPTSGLTSPFFYYNQTPDGRGVAPDASSPTPVPH